MHPHRTITLCFNDEVQRAYKLCREGFFDDYVPFWMKITNADENRLQMAVHLALRELAALAMLTTTEFVAQARYLETQESLLKEQTAQREACVNSTGQIVAQANADVIAAFDAFAQRLVDGELPDVVEAKNAESLIQEITCLKNKSLELTSGALEDAIIVLNQWRNKLLDENAPHLELIRALNTLADSAQQTLLVVDDDEFQHKIIGAILKEENYRLLFAASGNDAMNILRKVRPDLILMDIMMPGTDGMEVVRNIKGDPRLAGVPIIMITGKSNKDIVIESLKAGPSGFVVKPFTREILLVKVKQGLRSQ